MTDPDVKAPETDEQFKARLLARPMRIVLGKTKMGNSYSGVIENSWSMDVSLDRVLIFWSGPAYTIIGKIEIDGLVDAAHYKEHFNRTRPDMEFEVFDPLAEDCPVCIDWDIWAQDVRVGSRRKFQARNALFVMKEQ